MRKLLMLGGMVCGAGALVVAVLIGLAAQILEDIDREGAAGTGRQPSRNASRASEQLDRGIKGRSGYDTAAA